MYYKRAIPSQDLEYLCNIDYLPWGKMRNKTILVTGATGLIGFSLIESLLFINVKRKLGLSVLALVRDSERAQQRFGNSLMQDASLNLCVGNVEDAIEIEGPIDFIIHCASQTASKEFIKRPVETIRTSVLGTLQMLELAKIKESSGLVYLSSMEVYGYPNTTGLLEESVESVLKSLDTRNSYPISKLQCECLCNAYSKEYDIPVTIARLAQTFGPGMKPDDNRLFAEIARSIRNREDIILRTRGEAKHNYLYITDAISAIITIMLLGEPGQAYNVADESMYFSIADMAKKIATKNGVGLQYDLHAEKSCGYPNPTNINLDTLRLRKLGWSIWDNVNNDYKYLSI